MLPDEPALWFKSYVSGDRSGLLEALATLVAELSSNHEEWALAENARLASKARGAQEVEYRADLTEAAKARYVDAVALPNTQAVNEVRARIQALTEQRDLLRTLLQ